MEWVYGRKSLQVKYQKNFPAEPLNLIATSPFLWVFEGSETRVTQGWVQLPTGTGAAQEMLSRSLAKLPARVNSTIPRDMFIIQQVGTDSGHADLVIFHDIEEIIEIYPGSISSFSRNNTEQLSFKILFFRGSNKKYHGLYRIFLLQELSHDNSPIFKGPETTALNHFPLLQKSPQQHYVVSCS